MSILEKLKTETSALHAQIEASPLLRKLTSKEITAADYTEILLKFYGYFSPLEKQLETYTSQISHYLPDYEDRRKSDIILRDLAKLPNSKHPLTNLTSSPDIPAINSVSEAFGCIYVMEGSTLGGRVICRHLHQNLNFGNLSCTDFFGGYGDETGLRWTIFKNAILEFTSDHTSEENKIIESANQTFQKFYTWLNSTND